MYWGCVFRKCVLPKGLAKEFSKIVKKQRYLDVIDCTMVYPFPHANSNLKKTHMHLDKSPTCLEGSPGPNKSGLGTRGREIGLGFMDDQTK